MLWGEREVEEQGKKRERLHEMELGSANGYDSQATEDADSESEDPFRAIKLEVVVKKEDQVVGSTCMTSGGREMELGSANGYDSQATEDADSESEDPFRAIKLEETYVKDEQCPKVVLQKEQQRQEGEHFDCYGRVPPALQIVGSKRIRKATDFYIPDLRSNKQYGPRVRAALGVSLREQPSGRHKNLTPCIEYAAVNTEEAGETGSIVVGREKVRDSDYSGRVTHTRAGIFKRTYIYICTH
jgi:hypothetical protein